MSTTTQIKRLRQAGVDFVPITLSEAVVVNTAYMGVPGWETSKITTLDKVLAQYGTFSDDIQKQIATKQDKLTWDNYFEIDSDNKVHIKWGSGFDVSDGTVKLDFNIFEVATSLPEAGEAYLNKIYIIPLSADEAQEGINACAEYICRKVGDEYHWEKFGTIQAETDLSNYLTKTEFESYVATTGDRLITIEGDIAELDSRLDEIETIASGSLSAVNMTYDGSNIVVNYPIPDDLYADVATEGDGIEGSN